MGGVKQQWFSRRLFIPSPARHRYQPGTSPTIAMDGLAPGAATLTSRTFGVACAQVQATTPITRIVGAPVSVAMVAGQTANVAIVLRRPGNMQVTATLA